MDIKYKLYPYPVLWNENDDYNSSEFDCNINITRDIRKIIIEMNFQLQNKDIEELIKQGDAEYVLHIECPQTSYRNIIKTNQVRITYTIYDEEINDKISLCPFIISKNNIVGFRSIDWNEEYAGMLFDYERGSIMAIGVQQEFSVDKENMDLGNIPSIFTIYKRETVENLPVVVDIDQEKIRVGLNINDYDRYSNLTKYGDAYSINLVNAFIIFPVLIIVMNEMKNGFDDYSDRRWFKAIKKMMEKYTKEFNEEFLKDQDTFELAQKILLNPISSALVGIEEMMKVSREE